MHRSVITATLIGALVGAAALLTSGGPAAAQGGGTIVGEVKLSGAAPPPKVVKVNKDVEACGQEKKVADVGGSGGGLANAVVSVAGVKGARPAKKAVLDQKGCEFVPTVVVMAPGELEILNSDGVLHNIHTFSTANPAINKAQPKFKKTMTEKFDKPEVIKVQCDAHSWMQGWIVVSEGPAAASDDKGSFKIENVPPGKHKVEVMHPVLGKQSKEVEVKAGQESRVSFELAGKK